MPNLSESIASEPIRLLAYGMTGAGKTCLWGEMSRHEEFDPIYCMDFDLRIGGLRARLTSEEMARVHHDPFRDVNLQGEAYRAALSIANNPGALDAKYGIKFQTLVVDSQTFMGKSVMAGVLMLDGNKAATTNPQLQHYMSYQSLQEEFISKLCASGRHVVVTCHEDSQKDEVIGRLFKNVDLVGKSANRIPGYFNEFWHCELRQAAGKEPEYVVRVRSDVIYMARTSYSSLSAVEAQGDVWKKILAERTAIARTAITQHPKCQVKLT